jgi:hypothetical protein
MSNNNNASIQNVFMYGDWIGSDMPVVKTAKLGNENVYMIEHGEYTKMVSWPSNIAKYYTGKIADFDATKWDSYNPAPGHYLLKPPPPITTGRDKDPQCKAWAARTPSECTVNPSYMLANCADSCADYIKSPTVSPVVPKYTLRKGLDSGGNDIVWRNGATIDALSAECSANSACAGFNSGGWIKSIIRPENELNTNPVWNGALLDLYVKDTNPLDYMTLEEKCLAYEKLISTGTAKEKADYKLLYGAECLPSYMKNLTDCSTGNDANFKTHEGILNQCRTELKSCISEFKVLPKGHIESAWFGPNNGGRHNTFDVREKLVAMQNDGKIMINASTGTFGDPAPKVQKFLFINYRTDSGEFKKYKIPENNMFNIQFPNTDVKVGQQKGGCAPVGKQVNQGVKSVKQVTQGVTSVQQKPAYPGPSPAPVSTMSQIPHPQQRQNRPSKSASQRGGAKGAKFVDQSPYCFEWATRNPSDCVLNEAFMNRTCAKSCDDYRKANATAKPKAPPQGPDPLDDFSEYSIRKHREFEDMMKKYVPEESCPDIKDYVLKSDVIAVHQKALEIISEIKNINSINEESITKHPQYNATMDKYAIKTARGYVPCQQCL